MDRSRLNTLSSSDEDLTEGGRCWWWFNDGIFDILQAVDTVSNYRLVAGKVGLDKRVHHVIMR